MIINTTTNALREMLHLCHSPTSCLASLPSASFTHYKPELFHEIKLQFLCGVIAISLGLISKDHMSQFLWRLHYNHKLWKLWKFFFNKHLSGGICYLADIDYAWPKESGDNRILIRSHTAQKLWSEKYMQLCLLHDLWVLWGRHQAGDISQLFSTLIQGLP